MTGRKSTSMADGHRHRWGKGDPRTSYDDGHVHTVKRPSSGKTDPAEMDDHVHELPTYE